MTTGGSNIVNASFGAIFGSIFVEALVPIVNWLLVMILVIFADLVSAIRKHYLLGDEKIRFSKGVRDTMGKVVTYFAFVVAVVMIEVASGDAYDIDKWACLLICSIEGVSIINNILKPHGLEVSVEAIVRMFGKKADLDTDGVIKVKKQGKKGKDGK